MRTSIEIPDALLAKARQVARHRGTTLKQIVIEGLHAVVDQQAKAPRFRMRDGSFGKGGLNEGLDETDGDRIRELSYEGRGGEGRGE